MQKTLRATLVLTLVLLLLALALPALGTTESLESGVTVINDQIIAAPNTSADTIAMIEDAYVTPPAPPENYGGSLNLTD